MSRSPLRRAAWLALLASALACGGSPRTPTPAASGDYFPLVPGARWLYELRSELGKLQVEVQAKGERSVEGRPEPVFVMDETNRGPSLGFVQTSPVGYVVEEGFVARLPALDYTSSGALRLLGQQDVASRFLPLEPKAGAHWHQESRLFSTPEGGGARLGWSGEVRPLTSLTVPAGRFPEVLQVHLEYRDPQGAGGGPQVIYEDYYVRGVGLVRSVTRDPSGDRSHTLEQVLLEYEIPAAPGP